MSGSVEFVPGSRRAKIQVAVICLTSLLVIWLVDDLPSPFRGNNNYLSWFTIVPPKLLSVAAIAWMVRKMTSSPATRLRWSLLLLNQVLGTTAIVLYGIRIFLPAERVFSMGVPVLFVLLGVIPLLLAFSCEFSARETTAVRVLDVALALLTGILFVVLVYSLVNLMGVVSDAGLRKLNVVLLLQSVFLASCATLRLLGTTGEQERRFFFITSTTMWIGVVLNNVRNYMTLGQPSLFWATVWDFVAASLSFLFFVMIFAVYQPPAWLRDFHPSKKVISISRTSSSLFVGLALVGLCIGVSRHHFFVGAAGIFLTLVGYGLRNALIQESLVQTEEKLLVIKDELEALVVLDSLTGIPNRRAFDQALEREWHLTSRTNHPLGLLMIDIDHFKALNDTYGHEKGDQCIASVAKALQAALPRSGDFVARYGGEEFAALLPGVTLSGMEGVADRLCRAVHDLALENPASPTGYITVSIGAALGDFISAISPQTLLKAADETLYKAKDAGRDRIESIDLTILPAYDEP
jgi:diguanylate cyclase (GGDEF)-like protein